MRTLARRRYGVAACASVLVTASVGCTEGDEPRPWIPPGPMASARAAAVMDQRYAIPLDEGPAPPDASALRVTRVAVGNGQRCVITSDHTVRCWSWHSWHDLAELSESAQAKRPVADLSGVTRVVLGYGHGCALLATGDVRCWGSNLSGQIGDGTRAARTHPSPVLGLHDATAIAAGLWHTCARTREGLVKCWGKNDSGELGLGAPVKFTPFDLRSMPMPAKDLSHVAGIALGAEFSCAWLDDGTAYCWGDGRSGELGAGIQVAEGETTPTATRVEGIDHVESLRAGGQEACAILKNGEVWCWGANEKGSLGDGTKESRFSPVRVHDWDGVEDLQLGQGLACGRFPGGEVRCAGRWPGEKELRLTPTPVPLLSSATQLDLFNGLVGLKQDGTIMTWTSRGGVMRVKW